VDGDMELLKELAGIFLAECPKLMAEIRQAVDQRDARKLRLAAHTLKGSASHFGAGAVAGAAQRLEGAGAEQDWAPADEALAALECAIDRLQPALAELRQGDTEARRPGE
jgi:HPt (histidine-containing phosphotransfer) domain-containing protein